MNIALPSAAANPITDVAAPASEAERLTLRGRAARGGEACPSAQHDGTEPFACKRRPTLAGRAG